MHYLDCSKFGVAGRDRHAFCELLAHARADASLSARYGVPLLRVAPADVWQSAATGRPLLTNFGFW